MPAKTMTESQMMTNKKTKAQRFKHIFTEIQILFRIQWADIRDSWQWIVLMASMFPLTTLLFMKFFAVDASMEMVTRIVTGNMVFALTITGINVVAQDIARQKHEGHFSYYTSLPISKVNFILALLIKGFLSALPSIIILGIIGQWAFGIQFHYSLGLLPIMFFGLLSCVGIGTVIGFWSPHLQVANMLGQVAMMVISFMSPVMVEMSALPTALQWLAHLFPTTYLAEAFRILFHTGWSTVVLQDLVVLIGFSIISILAVLKLVDWRVKN